MSPIARRIFLILPLVVLALSGLFGLIRVTSQPEQTALPVVSYSLHHDLSQPLRQMTPRMPQVDASMAVPPEFAAGDGAAGGRQSQPPVIANDQPQPKGAAPDSDRAAGPPTTTGLENDSMPAPVLSFEGLNNADNLAAVGLLVLPPDPNGDIGSNHYVQWVNLIFGIWRIDRQAQTAALVYGPAAGNTLWQDFGGVCENNNNGDPIVLYDSLAGRWLMSQPAWRFTAPAEFHQCIAISQTDDPTGAWYRYDFLISTEKMNDYPKFGVWPGAYTMTANQFSNGWAGQLTVAFDREAMLAGQPAGMVAFDLYAVDPNLGAMLPADFDGSIPPPAGEPGYFVQFDDDAWGYSPDQLQIWQLNVDWQIPEAAVFNRVQVIDLTAAGQGFDSELCDADRTRCIDQPNTDQRLEALSDRLMHRLVYRNFGDHASLLLNHTVDVDGLGRAGIRWYELRLTDGSLTLDQSGTYSPDGDHRWMGSLAMDQAGNLALGYSVSGVQTYPSIRYAGRLAGDPPGELLQGETVLMPGGGSQMTFVARWGDYSMMAIDPVDDCTFWYTQEYYPVSSLMTWHTRIAAFRFPSCTGGASGNLHGRVTDNTTGAPIPGARVAAAALRDQKALGEGKYPQTITTHTDASGSYRFLNIPTDVYTVTASAYGTMAQTIFAVNVSEGMTTTQDLALTSRATAALQGLVSDEGHGWPLTARIRITAEGYDHTVFTSPFSGLYSLDLFEGIVYRLEVSAEKGVYRPYVVRLTVGEGMPAVKEEESLAPLVRLSPEGGAAFYNIALAVDDPICDVPGYQPESVYAADFELSDGGFTITGTHATWEWGAPSSGPGYAYSGQNVWATNLAGDYQNDENSALVSPPVDLSAYAGQIPIITWRQWLLTEKYTDFASLEVSRDGGLTWQPVYGAVAGSVDLAWAAHRVLLNPTYAVADLRLRFHLLSNVNGGTLAGWYVDDIQIGVIPPPTLTVYSEDFEANDGGYMVHGASSWQWGEPVSGPEQAHSGKNVWATNLAGHYGDNEDGVLLSPEISFSASQGQAPVLTWWQWLDTESGFDYPFVEVTNNIDGLGWQRVYGQVSGAVDVNGWVQHFAVLDPARAAGTLQVRFGLLTDPAVNAAGFYVDDVSVALLPVLPPAVCASQPGGLVVGSVFAAQSNRPLAGVPVSLSYLNTFTFDTPADGVTPDSFYLLFAPEGLQFVTASFGALRDTQSVDVQLDALQRLDFYLPVWEVWLPVVESDP